MQRLNELIIVGNIDEDKFALNRQKKKPTVTDKNGEIMRLTLSCSASLNVRRQGLIISIMWKNICMPSVT